MNKWYETHDNLAAFVRYLAHEERFTGEQIAAVVEKPWKWTAEYQEFRGISEALRHECGHAPSEQYPQDCEECWAIGARATAFRRMLHAERELVNQLNDRIRTLETSQS